MPRSDTHDDAPNATAKSTHGSREVSSCAVTINRPSAEVYAFYRDLTKAPLYMADVERVEVSGTRSHWVGKEREWDSEITKDVPNKEVTWQADGSSGRVLFEDVTGRGTVLTLTMAYEQGFIRKVVGKVTQNDPGIRARRDLRQLKQLLETGEIATNVRTRRELAEEDA